MILMSVRSRLAFNSRLLAGRSLLLTNEKPFHKASAVPLRVGLDGEGSGKGSGHFRVVNQQVHRRLAVDGESTAHQNQSSENCSCASGSGRYGSRAVRNGAVDGILL